MPNEAIEETSTLEVVTEPELKDVEVFVLLPDELQALLDAVSELPIKLGNGIFQGLQAVGQRGMVNIQVKA